MCVFPCQVQSEAFKATVAFITHLDSAQLRSRFIDMLPLLLAVSSQLSLTHNSFHYIPQYFVCSIELRILWTFGLL